MLLAIESSCDESACSIFDTSKIKYNKTLDELIVDEVISSQVNLHKEFGGVVPELASREHIKNLPFIVQVILYKNKIKFSDLTKIAVTSGPGLKGCLLVGVSYAKGLAFSLNKPLVGINHLEAHILSAFSNLKLNEINEFLPALALLVSGGHTQLIKINKIGQYQILANTTDDAAGEAFDKIGTLLGFSYPAGKSVSEAAKIGKALHKLPMPVQGDYNSFSFSGLKTSAALYIKKSALELNTKEKREVFVNDFSASLEQIIVESLISKTEYHLSQDNYKSLILSGGVAANSVLRKRVCDISSKYSLNCLIPRPELCTDNASMVGICALLRSNFIENNSINTSLEVKTRWNVDEVANL